MSRIIIVTFLFQTLEVLVHSVRSINTMSGAMTFVIGVCDHESYPMEKPTTCAEMILQ